jgi:hypothetical protein
VIQATALLVMTVILHNGGYSRGFAINNIFESITRQIIMKYGLSSHVSPLYFDELLIVIKLDMI